MGYVTRLAAVVLWLAGASAAVAIPDDPLESPQWDSMVAKHFGEDAEIVFDDRVRVLAAGYAEDAMETPVMVEAPDLPDVESVVVFADLNPITKILEYYPERAAPTLAFRFKIQQATPVRAAMRTADGMWHVGGTWIEAAGGGCTAPSVAAGSPIWESRLGEISGNAWARGPDRERLRFRVVHPMDTGLAAGIPVFHITDVTLATPEGETLARLKPFEPVSENPVISVDLRYRGPVALSGRDNNGNRFAATLPAPDSP
ncbi:MAG: quinoprotein dehydrogenase-associated SoxYZ-like carrier [Salinisphaeraceae bacterium]